jgi:hypothetical protein
VREEKSGNQKFSKGKGWKQEEGGMKKRKQK